MTDVDLHGHVNNSVHWQAVEHVVAAAGPDPSRPLRARLEFREPLDLGDHLELETSGDGNRLDIAFVTPAGVKAVAVVEPLS